MESKYFNAYYYTLEATGVPDVDVLLEAVADAGQGCHHTEDWSNYGYTEKIQRAADELAAAYKEMALELQRLYEGV